MARLAPAKTWLVLILLAWWLRPGASAVAQVPAPAANGWRLEAGLRGYRVEDLAQAPGQLLWVTTDEGVFRYDGPGRLVPLNQLRRGGVALPAVLCSTLLLTPDGQLWLGTAAGAFRFSPDGILHPLPLPAPAQALGAICCLVLARDGRHVWVGQGQVGVRRYTLAGEPAGPLLPVPELLLEAWPAPDGTLWLTSLRGRTRCYAPSGRLLHTWDHPHTLLRPVAEPGTGRVWLLSAERLYQPEADGRLTPGPSWRTGRRAGFQLVRQDTTLTLFSLEEIVQLSWTAKHGQPAGLRRRFGVAPPTPAGPAQKWPAYSHLWFDAAGRWWLFATDVAGTWTRAAGPSFIRALPGPGHQPYSVRSLHRLPDRRLLVSTYSGTLTQAPDSPLAPLRPWPGLPASRARFEPLMGIVPARIGSGHTEWLAASDHYFLRLDPRINRQTVLPTHELAAGIPSPLALARDPAPGSRVWGATSTGLYGYDSVAAAFRPYRPAGVASAAPPPLARQVIEDVCPDGQGHLWLAMAAGVVRLTVATGEQTLFGPGAPAGPRRMPLDAVRCLWLDRAAGRLWVGSRTGGLGLVDVRTGEARQVLSTASGLPSAHVASLLPGPGGSLWLGTYAGVVSYQPASGALAVFTTADGLSADECNARAAYLDPVDGSLLIGGVAGLHRLADPQLPGPRPVRPRLVLTAFTPLNVAATADSNRTRYRLATDPPPALALGPSRPVVDVQLALTDYADSGQSRFFYRISGWLGGRWLPLGTTALLHLQGLPPGRYEVEIRGETSQGLAAANALRLPLTVTAEWWRRPLTWGLAGLAGLALVFGWLGTRLRQQRRDYARRAQLAADLHDEVGALLTRVTMQAELLRELNQAPPASLDALVQDSRAAASTVRDIIWSVDAAADTLAALVYRIRDLLDATARAGGQPVRFDGAGLPPSLELALPPAVRQHTYLICKEAVTNVLRHAPGGAPLVVTLRYTPHLLELAVRNEGEPAAEAPGAAGAGQGLRNMQLRARLLRAELAAGPLPAGGWEVWLRVPL